MTRWILAFAALGACAEPEPSGGGTGAVSGTPAGLPSTGAPATGTPGGTPAGSTTGTGVDGPIIRQVDCSQLLPLPLTTTTHTWVPSHEDFTISADGRWIGTALGHLKATPWGGPSEILVPGAGSARGTRFLPDGTIVMADTETQSLTRADPATGSVWTVVGSLDTPNGIAIGWDGMVYIATSGRILRIDPDDGATEVMAEIPGRSFDGLSFSPDYRRLYFNEEIGRIHFVEFDEDMNPVRVVENAADLGLPPTAILDGMAVDACGNLYAVVMSGSVWRVTPTGDVERALTTPPGMIPALNFGSGVGGFERDHLYIQDFLGKMYEAPVGVPGKWEPHLPD